MLASLNEIVKERSDFFMKSKYSLSYFYFLFFMYRVKKNHSINSFKNK